jgi:hypothetical protein
MWLVLLFVILVPVENSDELMNVSIVTVDYILLVLDGLHVIIAMEEVILLLLVTPHASCVQLAVFPSKEPVIVKTARLVSIQAIQVCPNVLIV